MANYGPSWPVETLRRHSAVEDYQQQRRERLAKWIERDLKRLRNLEKTKGEPRKIGMLQERYVRYCQEYYSLGGIPKNLHPY